MDRELSILANDILRTIEREDSFDDIKKKGSFVKILKAKDTKKGIL